MIHLYHGSGTLRNAGSLVLPWHDMVLNGAAVPLFVWMLSHFYSDPLDSTANSTTEQPNEYDSRKYEIL
jgi:hypothetical protein